MRCGAVYSVLCSAAGCLLGNTHTLTVNHCVKYIYFHFDGIPKLGNKFYSSKNVIITKNAFISVSSSTRTLHGGCVCGGGQLALGEQRWSVGYVQLHYACWGRSGIYFSRTHTRYSMYRPEPREANGEKERFHFILFLIILSSERIEWRRERRME